jgi:hypothetical protein
VIGEGSKSGAAVVGDVHSRMGGTGRRSPEDYWDASGDEVSPLALHV